MCEIWPPEWYWRADLGWLSHALSEDEFWVLGHWWSAANPLDLTCVCCSNHDATCSLWHLKVVAGIFYPVWHPLLALRVVTPHRPGSVPHVRHSLDVWVCIQGFLRLLSFTLLLKFQDHKLTWNTLLGFWLEVHWIYRIIWEESSSLWIESSVLWTEYTWYSLSLYRLLKFYKSLGIPFIRLIHRYLKSFVAIVIYL